MVDVKQMLKKRNSYSIVKFPRPAHSEGFAGHVLVMAEMESHKWELLNAKKRGPLVLGTSKGGYLYERRLIILSAIIMP
jgi:hypothetical protein